MKGLKIYIDPNYGKRVIDLLERTHQLQKEKKIELINWTGIDENTLDLKSSVFLLMDYEKKGLSVPTIKHYEDGYKVIAFKAGMVEKLDLFEFMMTVFRVWPFIIDKSKTNHDKFLYTFKYGGSRLSQFKNL